MVAAVYELAELMNSQRPVAVKKSSSLLVHGGENGSDWKTFREQIFKIAPKSDDNAPGRSFCSLGTSVGPVWPHMCPKIDF